MLLPTLTVASLVMAQAHPWQRSADSETVAVRFVAPEGFQRLAVSEESFGDWLRTLPVKPGHPPVYLFNGKKKVVQDAHEAVLDIDVGKKNLQQCADAVMRLRAEYQWASNQRDEICFRFTNGSKAVWSNWRRGDRPVVRGNRVKWQKKARATPVNDYDTFRRYLERVFTYAGTDSLSREMLRVADPRQIEPGDIFIQGGFPGHAVLVVDVVVNEKGERRFLLAQSYMPAQEIHILKNPGSTDPWYIARKKGPLKTPEWDFVRSDLRRFTAHGCPDLR